MPTDHPSAAPRDIRWPDLKDRFLSGAVMVAVGTAAVIAGGVWFQMLVVFVTAVMIWELWSMIHPERTNMGVLLAALTASELSGFLTVDRAWFLLFLPIPPLLGLLVSRREALTFAVFAMMIQVAGWGLVVFRADYGPIWVLWLILVVVVTDIGGYFAGRQFGGPKFWPSVSPKKTWSGTVAGWVAAALVGVIFWIFTTAGPLVVATSVLLSFAGQMGDIAESALKRRMGVKDSSNLIPGHGGLFDRFDALLAASIMMLVLVLVFDVKGIAF